MASFDTLLEPDFVELRNAVEQCNKEIGTRFDFKGSASKVELTETGAKERELMLHADSDFQIGQVTDVLLSKLAGQPQDRHAQRRRKVVGRAIAVDTPRIRTPRIRTFRWHEW